MASVASSTHQHLRGAQLDRLPVNHVSLNSSTDPAVFDE
jgi:hypothetical protein